MAIGKQVSDNNPDGVSMGQSATDKISFYGATPLVRATIAANGTDAATTQTLANDIKAKLVALGLIQ
jgi:hypothetical protein